MDIYYNYVLRSLKDSNLYIGFTKNIKKRILDDEKGKVSSTKYRCPLVLIYYEVSLNQDSAIHREKYLKTSYGHRYLKNRIGNDFTGIQL